MHYYSSDYLNFAKIVEISGLKNISCTGCTVFAPRDDDIDDYYVQNCTRLDAVKIVKSSIMPNMSSHRSFITAWKS